MASFSIGTKKGKASNDEFYTPLSAWQSISHLVADGSVVWEPFIMLLPIGTASKQYMRPFVPDISLHIPKKRIHFESPTANPDRPNNTPFDVAFLSWRVTATSNHIEFL